MISEKWVFVAAGEKGIGSAIVRMLAREGYFVVFTYRTDCTAASELASLVKAEGGAVCSCHCDVRDAESVARLAKTLVPERGAPFAVIYNAGVCLNKPLVNTTIEEWKDTIDTNLNGLFFVANSFLSSMLTRDEACLITIGSIAGLRGNPGQTSYSAAKAAHEGFVRSLAREVGPFNIRVNTVAPGPIETRMLSGISEKRKAGLVGQTPMRRVGEPDDVAHMVRFLLGEGGQHITGQTLIVDGGLSV